MNPASLLAKAAEVALRRGEVERAVDLVERGWATSPRCPELFEVWGLLALRRNDAPTAERAFRSALEGGLMTSRTYCGLGLSLLELGQPHHARQSFQFATEVSGEEGDRWTERARHEICQLGS